MLPVAPPTLGDGRIALAPDLDAVKLLEMPADLVHRMAARIHGNDLVNELREAPLVLGDQLRIEAPGPVTWHRDRQL